MRDMEKYFFHQDDSQRGISQHSADWTSGGQEKKSQA